MRVEAQRGTWTHAAMAAVQMSGHQMFYFTERCNGCGQDSILSLELDQGDIRFRCPRCEAEVDHDHVIACDGPELNELGWVVKIA